MPHVTRHTSLQWTHRISLPATRKITFRLPSSPRQLRKSLTPPADHDRNRPPPPRVAPHQGSGAASISDLISASVTLASAGPHEGEESPVRHASGASDHRVSKASCHALQWVADEEAGMRMAFDAQTFTGKATHHVIISGLGFRIWARDACPESWG
jgi:hypothetical protein